MREKLHGWLFMSWIASNQHFETKLFFFSKEFPALIATCFPAAFSP